MKKNKSQISIIIPVLNEEKNIAKLLDFLRKNISKANLVKEIIIVDGGSADQSVSIAKENGAIVVSSKKGRAVQMNSGAKIATGDILYFLHVDTFPPKNFDFFIHKSISKNKESGCFRMAFDSSNLFLNFFAWFSKLNYQICRGGDQSLFITKNLFAKINGFNEEYKIYEDNEIIERVYENTKFVVLPQKVKTSARRYEEIGIYRLQFYFGIIHFKKLFGASPDKLYDFYRRKIAAS
ncbi:TIGR04283 family arsenosugar biosynthesis glycosyltransferase [uncultured Maribacter sp.]|uniref:TIGR04283 family arsenosugar biosynthesis glycosyltransferase n=1 Tax=uncultured Maribacter sp. TaxID=431308 RepID=UPI002629EDC0|nr:TIGR04283 family arsenosugar biosynthesis glycosyltransferase [uncultured Maribacter sp.]